MVTAIVMTWDVGQTRQMIVRHGLLAAIAGGRGRRSDLRHLLLRRGSLIAARKANAHQKPNRHQTRDTHD
jgi:hypothetical protein